MLIRYNGKILKYFPNLLDNNVGSLLVIDGLFERSNAADGGRSVILGIRAIFSGFFGQIICSINMIEYFFMIQ
jgi:hypothetical protein